MKDKERYSREAQAKGGSVPPDMRRNSKARSSSSKTHMPNQGSSFDKREQGRIASFESGELSTVDIERMPEETRKAIMERDLNP